ncbi:MAG: hypothetical protein ACJAZR_001179 [Sediminicola sp.]|jgi:hypothetical protein
MMMTPMPMDFKYYDQEGHYSFLQFSLGKLELIIIMDN